MPADYRCPRCAASIAAERVDAARQIATCAGCGNLVDLAPQMRAAAAGEGGAAERAPRQRPAVPLPAGMAIRRDSRGLVLTRRWLRSKHFVLLAVLSALTAALVWAWQTRGFEGWMAVAAFFVASWDFLLLGALVNSTTITASDDAIDVRHGPLPTPLAGARRVRVAEVEQLFVAPFGGVFEVGAILRDKTRVPLVRPLVTQEQALFVEQQIERRLGLIDAAVAGELGSELPLPAPVEAPVQAGGAWVLGLIPVALSAVMFFVFFVVLGTEVEGTIQLAGARAGDQAFTPTTCRSGQLAGFFGVELAAKEAPGVAIRLVRDPVQGELVVVERAGQAPFAVRSGECEAMRLEIVRTSTNINDVWNVEGSATLACAELRGAVRFSGCH